MEKNKIEEILKATLAEQIGVEVADINSDDTLSDELHLGASEITDLLSKLEERGIETNSIENIQELTVSEIADEISLNS
jgi:hypothetical protein